MMQKHNSYSIRLIFLSTVILAVIQVIVSSRLVSLDSKLGSTIQKIEAVAYENEEVSQKIASASALATITELSLKQGFRPQTRYTFLYGDYPLALEMRK